METEKETEKQISLIHSVNQSVATDIMYVDQPFNIVARNYAIQVVGFGYSLSLYNYILLRYESRIFSVRMSVFANDPGTFTYAYDFLQQDVDTEESNTAVDFVVNFSDRSMYQPVSLFVPIGKALSFAKLAIMFDTNVIDMTVRQNLFVFYKPVF